MRSLLLSACTGAAVLALGDAVFAQVTDLQPGRNFPTAQVQFGSGRSENVDLGDVDNDGDYDVVIANGGDGSAQANRIYVNNGGLQGGAQGTFSDGTAARFSGVPNDTSRDIELADFDGDCDLDIYVSNRGTTTNGGEVSRAYINQGGAQFGNAGFYSEDSNGFWGNLISVPNGDQVFGGNQGPWRDFSCDCDFGDLDLDGDLDLFHSSYGPNINGTTDSRVFLNDGEGVFNELWPWINAGADIRLHTLDIDLVDLDDDYDFDVFASSRDSQARVYRNNLNAATLTFPANPFTDITQGALIATGATLVGTNNYECEFGDVDGDGDFDIYGKNYQNFSDRILINNGNLTFTKQNMLLGDPNVDENEADFLDFDSDGDLDLFMANFSGTNAIHVSGLAQGVTGSSLYRRAGTNGYPQETPNSGNGGTTLDGECADMDGDGDPDIMLSNDANQNNRYWQNTLGVPDTHAPTIHQVDRQVIGGDSYVRVQLRDNASYYVVGYYNVDLLYTVNGGIENRVQMFSQGSQQFQGVIPGGLNGNISYRIAGSDDNGNTFSSGSFAYVSSGSGVVLNQSIDDGTAGSNGVPYLTLDGSFAGGSVVSANLCDVLDNAPAILFGSLASAPALFKGGLLHTIPIALEIALNTGNNSQVYFEAVWPAGLPAGTDIWFQYGVGDAGGTGGAALSNAVKISTP